MNKSEQLNRFLGSASLLAVIVGAAYIIDCRCNSTDSDQIERCWLTGLPIMGLGTTGQVAYSAYQAGYNTYNPALRKKNDDEQTSPEQ